MLTQFKPVPGYELLYEINESGQIKQIPRIFYGSNGRTVRITGKYLSTRTDKRSGYLVTALTNPNRSRSTQYVHRLVALTWVPNPQNKPFVNHLNGNKLDPRSINLEWVTASENKLHALKTNLARAPRDNYTPIRNMCTGEKFPSIKAAAASINMTYDKCKRLFNGNRLNRTCLRLAA